MKQTIDITNSLYKSVFDLNPELKARFTIWTRRGKEKSWNSKNS
jgi:hemoglobin-like flavoprotein